ncbi:transcriptional regulator [Arthrobacter alpinus]|uniref:transcriptional regulator n=1 Tax=Arthrobacter alpinus TaxID=656366 RepID=UPI0016472EC9|nr:transcriptional regulator [Arthrobacter alpinus]
MSAPSSSAVFDELIYAPVRLRICAGLAPVQWAEFAQLPDVLGVADSVVSNHLKQLTNAGYVDMKRFTKGGGSHVRVALTAPGRNANVGHIAALRTMHEMDL